MTEYAIEIKGLCKNYPGFSLDHLNLTLPSGCILGLVGENGAGKSTTIRLILDLVRKDEGSIAVLGKDAGDENASIKEDIGVVLDKVGLPLGADAVRIGKIMQGIYTRWDPAVYESYLDRLKVPKDKKFSAMSNGTKMKLGLAVALSHHPKLLILDEATNGLDPVVRDDVNDILTDFTRDEDHSVLISSHLVGDLEKLCDYIAFLHEGRLLLCEEKDALAEKYGLIRCAKEDLEVFDKDAVLHSQFNAYGAQAVVLRDRVPAGMDMSPVSIEELFVTMVKEMRKS